MEKTNLQVSFDAEKLDLLRFYMSKKEMNVEDELQAHLDKLYEKMVPVLVREYIESRSGIEVPKQEVKIGEDAVSKETGVGEDITKQEDKAEENTPVQENRADNGKSAERSPRQGKRQREKELVAVQQLEPQQEQTDGLEETGEENQGMSMGM